MHYVSDTLVVVLLEEFLNTVYLCSAKLCLFYTTGNIPFEVYIMGYNRLDCIVVVVHYWKIFDVFNNSIVIYNDNACFNPTRFTDCVIE